MTDPEISRNAAITEASKSRTAIPFADWVDKETRQRISAFLAECEEREKSGKPRGWEQNIDERPLGSLTNEEYLRTKLWRRIRRRVLKRDSRQCRCCGGKAPIVHHRSYARDVKEGKNDEQLASICEGCHNFIHFDDFGAWRTPEETDLLLLRGRHDTTFPVPKVDLRRKGPQYPPEWARMNAVQRSAWEMEYHRVWLLRRLSKVRDKQPQAEIYRRWLREEHGMDDAAIDAELRMPRSRKT